MKRERKKHITRLHIILFFLVIIIGLIVFFVVKNIMTSDKKYKEFEQVIKDASQIYYKINKLDLAEDEEEYINIKKLDEQGLLSDNTLISKCKGYVIVSNELDYELDKYKLIYRPYIDCGKKYSSINYQEAIYIEITENE